MAEHDTGPLTLGQVSNRIYQNALDSDRPGVRLLRQRADVESGAGFAFPLVKDLVDGIMIATGLRDPEDESANAATAVEQFGVPGRDAPTFDITDPAIDIGDFKITKREQRIRNVRRMSRILRAFGPESLGGDPTANPLSTNIEGLYESGKLAPPANESEQMFDFIARNIPITGAFGGLAGPARSAAAVPFRAAAASPAGRSLVGAVAQGAQNVGILPGAATQGGRLAAEAAVSGAVTKAGGAVVGETALGAGFGLGFGLEPDPVTGEINVSHAVLSTLIGGGLGLGIGGFVGAKATTLGLVRTARELHTVLEAGILPSTLASKGMRLGPRVVDHINPKTGKISYRAVEDFIAPEGSVRADGTSVAGKAYKKGQPTVQPTPGEIREFSQSLLEAFRNNKEAAMEMLGAKNVDEAVQPGTLQDRNITTLEQKYAATARGRVRDFAGGEEGLRAEITELELSVASAETVGARDTALAQVRALKRALGDTDVPILPGTLPLEKEGALHEILATGDDAFIRAQIAEKQMAGLGPEASRLLELLEEGVPRRDSNAMNRIMSNKAIVRGITKDSNVIMPDGKVWKVKQARFGYASGWPIDAPPGTPAVGFSLAEAVAVPRVGTKVLMKDGTAGVVKAVDPGTMALTIEAVCS